MSAWRGINLLNHRWYAVIVEDKYRDPQVLCGQIKKPFSFFSHFKELLMIRWDIEKREMSFKCLLTCLDKEQLIRVALLHVQFVHT